MSTESMNTMAVTLREAVGAGTLNHRDSLTLAHVVMDMIRDEKAEAWDEGFDEGEDYGLGIILAPGNPYRRTE